MTDDNVVYRNPSVRQHLKNVYGCLSLSTVSAAVGAYVHMNTQLLQANLLTTFGSLGLLIALMSTPDNGKNQKLRLGYLMGFTFLSGLGLGPLLELVISIDPSIVVTALVGEPFFFSSSFLTSATIACSQDSYWLLYIILDYDVLMVIVGLWNRVIFTKYFLCFWKDRDYIQDIVSRDIRWLLSKLLLISSEIY